VAFDKAKKEEVREIGARPWNIPVEPETKPIYTMKCIIILGTEVTATKRHWLDEEGSALNADTTGKIVEVQIKEDGTYYGIEFEEIYWIIDTPCGTEGRVDSGVLYFTIEQMDEIGIVVEGREVNNGN